MLAPPAGPRQYPVPRLDPLDEALLSLSGGRGSGFGIRGNRARVRLFAVGFFCLGIGPEFRTGKHPQHPAGVAFETQIVDPVGAGARAELYAQNPAQPGDFGGYNW
ncbi:MAG: hypothetical protein K2V38_00740, partial [Gemmataceae bacterium]|nr:hypothetical protein [Gemmataceae bacterium]